VIAADGRGQEEGIFLSSEGLMIVAAPYLSPAQQLNAQLRAMVRAGEKLPTLQQEQLQEELENIYSAVRNLRRRYEIITGGEDRTGRTIRRKLRVHSVIKGESTLQAIWERYLKRKEIADRNLLIEHYLPLVKLIAARLWATLPEGIELDDLISTGVFGLIDALGAFDPNKGVQFQSYSQQADSRRDARRHPVYGLGASLNSSQGDDAEECLPGIYVAS